MDDDYDLLPHKEILELKKTVEDLKGGPSAKNLMTSMDELNANINELMGLFKAATKELKTEEKDEESVSKKLNILTSQNKTIAEGMVKIANMVEKMNANASNQQQNMPPQHPLPQANPVMQQAPPAMPPQPNNPFTNPNPSPAPPAMPTPPIMPPQSSKPEAKTFLDMPSFPMEKTPNTSPPAMPGLEEPSNPENSKEKRKGLFSVFKKE